MKAILYNRYGSPDVLHLGEIPRPEPGEDELLVRIKASSINSRDWRLLRAEPFFIRLMGQGLTRPKHPILGADVAGVVEAAGPAVRDLQPGDEVYGFLDLEHGGAYADYVCAAAGIFAPKPANLSFEQAAAVPLAALTALQGLRDDGRIQAGQQVLIHGASGGVGAFAVQLARAFDTQVTAVCSTRNVEMVRSFGADTVVDYKKEDVATLGRTYDLVLAVNGYRPLGDYLSMLAPDGRLVVAGGSMRQLFAAMLRRRRNAAAGQQVHVVDLQQSRNDLLFLTELLQTGRLVPVVDRVYALEDTADAFRSYERDGVQGKIVIAMNGRAAPA